MDEKEPASSPTLPTELNGGNRRRCKLNIIKRFLGTNEWYLKEDKTKYPDSVFVFNGDGRIIMSLNTLRLFLWVRPSFIRRFQYLFGFLGLRITRRLIVNISKIHFNWDDRIKFGPGRAAYIPFVEKHFNNE